jgi:hypothetical protein
MLLLRHLRAQNTKAPKRIDPGDQLLGEVLKPLKNRDTFIRFTLNDFTIEWPNGADFWPE